MGDFNINGTSVDSNGSTTTWSLVVNASATSSPAQVQTNLFNGFILFFLVASLVIGYFTIKFKK